VALSAYALVSVAELKVYIGAEGSGEDQRFEDAINRATAWIENQTERHFITRGSTTEYHTVDGSQTTIRASQWPIISITSIHESTTSPRVYDGTSLLTAATDYQHVAETGLIHRLSSSELTRWAWGYRAIKLVFQYGYATASTVPEDLRQLCLFVATSIFKEADRQRWGVSSVTDATGSVTRFLGYLPPDMKAHLESFKRWEFDRTWEAA